jgi:hypothetical protein
MPEGLLVSMNANSKPNSDVAKPIPVTTNQISSHFILPKPSIDLEKNHPLKCGKMHPAPFDSPRDVSSFPIVGVKNNPFWPLRHFLPSVISAFVALFSSYIYRCNDLVLTLSSSRVSISAPLTLRHRGRLRSLLRLFRTTDPARLHDDHYIRKAISYLGTVVAQHSALTIIITVAIGISLSLPVPFLYSPASSVNYLKPPNHVWISAESFANGEALVPDISIKQAWIHGSWMKALERETLLEAIAVQDMLLGPMLSYHSVP